MQIGYALGRIESKLLEDDFYARYRYCGHVSSIAINSKFRGHGVAKNLIEELHKNFAKEYDIDTSDLYCRVSKISILIFYSKFNMYT
jgi:ribosomal protein S18 acetylase RimI-like enzyme